jgi:hypothetical protein
MDVNTHYSFMPLLVLAVAVALTILIVVIIKGRNSSSDPDLENAPGKDLPDITATAFEPKSIFKNTLKCIGYNLLAGLVIASPLLFLQDSHNDGILIWAFIMFVIGVLSLLVQLILGIAWASGNKKKNLGKGMLFSVLFFLLLVLILSLTAIYL